MTHLPALQRVAAPLGDSIEVSQGPAVQLRDAAKVGDRIEALVRTCVIGEQPDRSIAQWLIRELAVQAGARPASIHELY
ncbi:MAG: hypothetical protein ACRDG5_10965, partial [Anaerolineales bacterium]